MKWRRVRHETTRCRDNPEGKSGTIVEQIKGFPQKALENDEFRK